MFFKIGSKLMLNVVKINTNYFIYLHFIRLLHHYFLDYSVHCVFCQHKKHNRTLFFCITLLKHCRHFYYWNQPPNMRMRVCYVDCHEAGLYCYLVIHKENLVNLLQLFYLYLWPIYWLSFVYINSVRSSQETHYVPATKPNRLMLFRETVAVYCENHMEHTYTICVQKTQFVPHRKHIKSPLQSPTG
jgi:hypothetical protein